jgi:hypothetical protein
MPWAGLADDVAVSGECVQHKHGVVAGSVELAPRLVGDPRVWQGRAVLERERAETDELSSAVGVALAPGAGCRGLAEQRSSLRVCDEARRLGIC